MFTNNKNNIRVDNHEGTWSVIDEMIHDRFGLVYLLEHEEFGDESACVITDYEGFVISDNVWNGFDDLDN